MPHLLKYALIVLVLFGANAASYADSEEDNTWIAQCMADNKKEGQTVETVMVYCHCMNEQMSDSETRSITEWEKTHPGEEKQCSKKAGWN